MIRRPPIRLAAQISLKPGGQHAGAQVSPVRPESRPESRSDRKRPFLEDFNMEHSCSNVTVALRAFSVSSDPVEPGKSRSISALSTNTPSCIYLG
jgi:hypothetical protein